VSRTEATVEEILGLLPDIDELEVLRLGIVRAAVPDPEKAWESSSMRATIDKRIVGADAVEQAVDEAERALIAYIQLLHGGLRPALRAYFDGRPDETAQHLITLGEQHEGDGRLRSARQCYRAALSLSLPLVEKAPQILALRRIARVSVAVGDFQEAFSHYERSTELARDSLDLHGEVIGQTGIGNVLFWQGRLAEAEDSYRLALALAERAPETELRLERGHLFNNLGNLATRTQRLDDAELWIARALELWEGFPSPVVDLVICWVNRAHLREVQGRWEEAREAYERALKLPATPSVRAGVAIDLAEWYLREGHLTQAEEWTRVAEEHAIASGSPYTLGRMYQARGNIARAQEDADGFIFYEKALEIARDKGYPFLEGETALDYAQLRAQTGGAEEAVAYLERACEIFRSLGTLRELERAEKALAGLAPAAAPQAPAHAPAPLAAAAGH
jgi:tetratricopeptide (TPR) repeat protein